MIKGKGWKKLEYVIFNYYEAVYDGIQRPEVYGKWNT